MIPSYADSGSPTWIFETLSGNEKVLTPIVQVLSNDASSSGPNTSLDLERKQTRRHSTIEVPELDDDERLPASESTTARQDCLTVFGAWCCMLSTLGVINAVGLLQRYMEENQLRAFPPRDVGWIASTNICLTLMAPLGAGLIFDRCGQFWLMAIGSFAYALGLIMMSFFDGSRGSPTVTFWVLFLSWGVLCGSGAGFISTAVTGVTCRSFDKNRGLACGTVSAGSSIGGIIWPLLLRITLKRWGWSRAVGLMGGLAILLLLIGNVCIKGRGAGSRALKPAAALKCFLQADFLWMTGSLMVFQFVVMGVVGTLPTWGAKKAFDRELIFCIVATMNAGSVVGRFLVGWLSDRIGRFNAVILAQLLSILFIFLFLTVDHTIWKFYALAPCWGFASGAILSMMTALVREVCEKEEFGTYFGANSAVVSIGGLLCVPSGAQLLESYGPNAHMTFFGGSVVLSTFLLCMSRWAKMRWSWRWFIKV